MPEFVELPPIANEALSLVLLADNEAAHLEKVIADWVTCTASPARVTFFSANSALSAVNKFRSSLW